jgi:glycerol kinase
MVLPALAGLGAPWWRAQSQGVIAGLHPGVGRAHLARAALEAIAWRVADIVEAAGSTDTIHGLRVDGGLSNDEALLQIQADAVGLPLTVGAADSTALGAALLAGVGAGIFEDVEQAARRLPAGRVVQPCLDGDERGRMRERWQAFVRRAALL